MPREGAMGWASTYENIIERLHNDVMAMAKSNAQPDGHSSAVDRAGAIQRACESVIRDLRDFMELATDPTFDFAATYRALEKEVADLQELLAKTARDRLMCEMDLLYPGYGFSSHKGYRAQLHADGLMKLGPCPEHRLSWGPVKLALMGKDPMGAFGAGDQLELMELG